MNTVAIQGIKGSYSEEAVVKMLGAGIDILECRTFAETFEAVTADEVKYALVPLKNKIVGEIRSAMKIFEGSDLKVRDELALEVRHVLVGTPDAEFSEIGSVRSHIEAFRQCAGFLTAHLNLKTIVGSDTASSVRRVIAQKNPKQTAIGSRRAAEIYGGKILMENIADDPMNETTFYLLSK